MREDLNLLEKETSELFDSIEKWDAAYKLIDTVNRLESFWRGRIQQHIQRITPVGWVFKPETASELNCLSGMVWVNASNNRKDYAWCIWLWNNELRIWTKTNNSSNKRIKEVVLEKFSDWESIDKLQDNGTTLFTKEWLKDASSYNFAESARHQLVYQLKDQCEETARQLKACLQPIFNDKELQKL